MISVVLSVNFSHILNDNRTDFKDLFTHFIQGILEVEERRWGEELGANH